MSSRIWIDITHPAHVWWFKETLERLKKLQYEVFVTAQDFERTVDLLKLEKISFFVTRNEQRIHVKRHLKRIHQLKRLALNEKPDMLLSGSSAEASPVAYEMGIPLITVTEDPHLVNLHRVSFPLSDRIVVPEVVDAQELINLGAFPSRVVKFKGFFTTSSTIFNFRPNPYILEKMKLDIELPIVVIRPSRVTLLYFRVFAIIKGLLNEFPSLQILVIPRNSQQAKELKSFFKSNIVVPDHAVDCPNLLRKASLVIGGGTMDKEATFVGTPAIYDLPPIPFYKSGLPPVEDFLIERGFLYHAYKPSEILQLAIKILHEPDQYRPRIQILTSNLVNPSDILIQQIHSLQKVCESSRACECY